MHTLSGPSFFCTKALKAPYGELLDIVNSLSNITHVVRISPTILKARTDVVFFAIRTVPGN